MPTQQDLSERAQLDAQFAQTPVVLWGNFVVGTLTGIFYFPAIQNGFVAIWYALLLALICARYLLYKAYQKSDANPDATRAWLLAYTAGTFFTGLCWAILGLCLIAALDGESLFVLFLALVGLTGANIATACYRKRTFLCFSTPVLLPTGLAAVFSADKVLMMMGSFSLALYVLSLIAVHRLHQTLSAAIAISARNRVLVAQLEGEKHQLKQSNQRLARELQQKLSMTKWLATATASRDRFTDEDISQGDFPAALSDLWEQAIERQEPLALIMLELDGERHWPTDTQTLDPRFSRLQEAICGQIRSNDFFIRLNDREFSLILWKKSAAEALSLVNRLRRKLAASKALECRDGNEPPLTLSWGVAGWIPNLTQNASELIAASRRAKQIARSEGGNRVSLG